ncbi:hypothetical protein ECE50_002275 [Chitinophaga sp. Mgbs1]|uniref:Uncharacterized protein n=1 Tax=Chitinophaga solisilvae TaxID=1233460 RepID=A0A3S1CZH7_9BACT|nr:hypothetical protein [Chitinophaga solisilvae]
MLAPLVFAVISILYTLYRYFIKKEAYPLHYVPSTPKTIQRSWTEEALAVFAGNWQQVMGYTDYLSRHFDVENGDYKKVFRKTPFAWNGVIYETVNDLSVHLNDASDVAQMQFFLSVAETMRKEDALHYAPMTTAKGRIGVYVIDFSLTDGAAEDISREYVDVYEMPPLDTWIYIDSTLHLLYFWVPETFIPVVQDAADVTCSENICWLEDKEPDLIPLLKAAVLHT